MKIQKISKKAQEVSKKSRRISKKAQELPVKFIVIVVISTVVLLAVIMFFMMGFRTEAVSMQTAVNACDTNCMTENRYSRNKARGDYPNDDSSFCRITQTIQGYPEQDVRCDEITTCVVMFRDGSSCMLNCNNSQSKCN